MTKKQKKNLVRICLALVLGIAVYCITRFVDGIPFWGSLLMYSVPYFVVGYDVLLGAGKSIVRGRFFNERFLMALATVGAFVIGEYPEAVAVMLFYQVGELFQGIAVGKSRKSIASLMDIRPDEAVCIRNGEEVTLSPDEVAKGERIIVRPGERIPLDGVIVKGTTSVDASALTGESIPFDKREGDEVLSGCVNVSGVIEVETTGTFGESTVSKILHLVEEASEKKSKSENFISKFAKYYTPAVVIGAVLLAVIPPLFLGMGDVEIWKEWVHRALLFLVVSCPCALVISVPLSFFGGIGGASKRGILVKGAAYLEKLANPTAVTFDKTGTLTQGKFAVTSVYETDEGSGIVETAALAESFSTHPIACSVVAFYGKPTDKERVSDVRERAGYGIDCVIDGEKVFVGNALLMREAGVTYKESDAIGTVVHVARGQTYLGHLVIGDRVKETSAEAIAELKRLGVKRTVMLTGDRERVANAVGETLGLDEVKSGLLPAQKVEEAEKIISSDKVTVYVGDGINDAPVLSRADVGVAMGGIGSDAAIEAADVVIMDDNLKKLPESIRIARKTMRIVYENIVFALGVKLVVLVLGALGIASMWLAVFADVGVAVIAVLNAMRALKVPKQE